MGFPFHDPQFWLATSIFVFAAAWLLRGVLPIPILSRKQRAAKGQRRVSLTIEGKDARRGR